MYMQLIQSVLEESHAFTLYELERLEYSVQARLSAHIVIPT